MADITATDARRDFFELVKGATEKHEVFHIRHRKGSVVLLSEEDYASMVETLELLSIPGMRQSLQRSAKQVTNGETFSLDSAFGEE
jgi:antitoxin YefM